MGFGPGGSAYGALLECRDNEHEILVTVVTDFHDDEDATKYSHHLGPKNLAKDVIQQIDASTIKKP
jgi:hypothetical protein